MVYSWCTLCQGRESACTSPDNHRAQSKIVWRADFLLGGRYGKRIRKTYPNGISKKEAEKFEVLTKADFERGKYVPTSGIKSKTLFKDFIKEYIETYVNNHMKGAKFEKYRFVDAIRLWGNRPIHTINHSDGENYIKERLKMGILKTSINREITSLKVAFKWAIENDFIAKHPFEKIKKFKEERIRQRWLSEQEIEILLNASKTLKDFDMVDIILIGINTGFRDANLRSIEARHILGNRLQALRTKSGTPYDVPINQSLKEVLEKLIRLRSPNYLLNFKNFRKRWDRLVKFVGLHRPNGNSDNVTLHTLRHTFVAQCLRKGIPIDVVCKWANHHSVEFTRKHYGHLAPDTEDKYINQLTLGVNDGNWSENALYTDSKSLSTMSPQMVRLYDQRENEALNEDRAMS